MSPSERLHHLLLRLQPYAMLAIDLVVPVLLLGTIGRWLGKPEFGLALGFGLGILAYLRHWRKMDKQAADFTWLFGKVKPAQEVGQIEKLTEVQK